ncbi:MAG: class I SAM-dependent methyltransferase [Pseudobdellovibrionaceae bacterium]
MRQLLYKIKSSLLGLYSYPKLISEKLSYEDYWHNKKKDALGLPNSFQLERGKWIAERILEDSSVVDIGCGDGSVLFAIKKIKNISATGLDVSSFILDFLKRNDVESYYFDLLDKDAISSIPIRDHALILEVLEHMSDPENFLLQTIEKVNKSVFISIPNTGFIQHRIRLLFGKFPLQWRTHPSEHLRFWTVDDFKWWLQSLNLHHKTHFECYAGIPILNKIFPSLFCQGIIAEIKRVR